MVCGEYVVSCKVKKKKFLIHLVLTFHISVGFMNITLIFHCMEVSGEYFN